MSVKVISSLTVSRISGLGSVYLSFFSGKNEPHNFVDHVSRAIGRNVLGCVGSVVDSFSPLRSLFFSKNIRATRLPRGPC